MVQKSVLITGCSEGGIGESLAKAFHRKGLRVFATARDLAKVEHLKSLGMDIFLLDVIDEISIKQAVERVKIATGGTLDILVNNSGSVLDSEISIVKKMFDVNVFAVIAVTQAFAPLLIASKGRIVNIGSIAGHAPLFWNGYYNASKGAVNILTQQLRLELAPLGIKVILVTTGGVKTKFFDNQPSVTLPADSVYAPGRTEIEHAAKGNLVADRLMDVDVYAHKVVNNALKRDPTVDLWCGGGTTLVWFLVTFLPGTIWDLFLPKKYSIPTIARKIKAAEKSK
ncbi:hypothetical protein B7494_g4545 [Chlorociboria aeruginascens]|nr:hypothetical protein B7494_g4545 [Chlorociboria aeruginascens]